MSKELPFYKFTANEWLTGDICFESFDVQGLFISVCATYWSKDCSITLSRLKQRLSNASEEQWQCLIDGGYIKVDKDNVSISFLDEQMSELSEQHRKKVEAGRKGGEASAKQRSSNAQATVKHRDIEVEVDKDVEVDKEHKLITWISANATRVNKMKEPLTFEQCTKLKEDFHNEFIMEILTSMHNYEPLLRKNRNANLTFRNWANRDERYKKWRESKGIIQPNLNLK